MFVKKRDGQSEPINIDEISQRVKDCVDGLDERYVDPSLVVQKVTQGLCDGMNTHEIDVLVAETAAHLATVHPDYSVLAARITISNLHKRTSSSFAEVVERMDEHKNGPKLNAAFTKFVKTNREALDKAIDYERDFQYDYFGFKTLERSYLFKIEDEIVERPQHLIMRVACQIHLDDLDAAIESYTLMSQLLFTHASPTLFNAGTESPQLASCFLVKIKGDSLEGIYDTLKDCAMISKYGGGIGLSIHEIRCSGSTIEGTNGHSNGILPMLRVFNSTARYVDQGGGKRKGAIAIYLEPWHADIELFLECRLNHGHEEMRTRDLNLALWIPDLFMKRVKENGSWSLFDPKTAPSLNRFWGEPFEKLYTSYEKQGLAIKTVKARDLWTRMITSQIETGYPYMLFKDSCNRKSNQQHLGTIECANLCCEIAQYSSKDEISVCNLASIALSRFVTSSNAFDFQMLYDVTYVVTKNLNKVIDRNYYPLVETQRSNLRHRPIGIGVQGLADVFMRMRHPYDSPEAATLNEDIFETILFAALTASCDLAKVDGPYESYEGSPVSRGVLQPDMWGVTPKSGRWDWKGLRESIALFGLRNSLLVAPMPTASTSQILGNSESFEPYTSNIYNRRTLAGEFMIVNRHLVKDLVDLKLWSTELKNKIIAHNGSIAHITEIPETLRSLYKTVWEIKMKTMIDMAADRGAYIDQSQSFNVYVSEPSMARISSMHFHSWEKGLKTGMYYMRTRPQADAIKFTLDPTLVKASEQLACSLKNRDACISCSS